ncbi:MAG: flavin reductase family protein [Deltaproteobacteria bacterium]|nr:MAG: flavin reductase family protein [Deltaproteobacteria bacterium]
MKIIPADLTKKEAHELLMSVILPRPIAFVSTLGEDGVFNLAPFSCFAPVGLKPALVCLQIGWKRDGHKKDTLKNIESSKDFVVNVVDEALAEAMNQTSAEYPSDVDEFKEAGLTAIKSDLVGAPRVAESPVNMECRLLQILNFGEAPTGSHIIIGEIVLLHVKDELWCKDQIDILQWKAIGRLGGNFYCRTRDIFQMKPPAKYLDQ